MPVVTGVVILFQVIPLVAHYNGYRNLIRHYHTFHNLLMLWCDDGWPTFCT